MNPTDRIGSRFQNQISKPGNEVFLDSVDCTIGSGIGITISSAEKRSDRYRRSTPARKRIDFALLLSTPSTWWVISVCPGVRGSSSSSRVVSPSHPHTSCSLPPANPRPAHAQCWSNSNWRSCRSHRHPILPVCTRLNVEEQQSSALFVTAAGKATLASRRVYCWKGDHDRISSAVVSRQQESTILSTTSVPWNKILETRTADERFTLTWQ